MIIIQTENLSKTYPNGKVALKNINIEINKGEMVGILGLSGSGKTTFFRLLNGAITPTEGKIKLFGQSLLGLNHKALRKLRKKMALVYQHHNIVPGLSVARNVFLGLLNKLTYSGVLRGIFYLKASEVAQIYEILNKLGIADKIYQRGTDLSGGQQQRVALARAMIGSPEIILADEPIASVDSKTAELILELFKEINNKKQTTFLLNLHQVDVALDYCSRVLVFNQGNLIFDGPPKQVPLDIIYEKQTKEQLKEAACDGKTKS